MPKTKKKLKPGIFIQLENLKDIARLACPLERVPLPIFCIDHDNEKILAIQMDIYAGTPVFYYTKVTETKDFLAYRNSAGVEESLLVDAMTNPSYIYAPIISIAKIPPIFREGLDHRSTVQERYLGFEVKGLSSLVKVSAYKVAFEEPPIPIFQFRKDDGWILGCFTRMDDYEEAALFFYHPMDSPVTQSFVKYSTSRVQDVGFTNSIDEHGFLFIKIIKLAEEHPLVELQS